MCFVTDGIVDHMKKQAGPDSVLLHNEKDLEAFIDHFDASVIGECMAAVPRVYLSLFYDQPHFLIYYHFYGNNLHRGLYDRCFN